MDNFTKEQYIAFISLMMDISKDQSIKLYQSDIDDVKHQYNLALLEISDQQLE